jgi:NAD-dependent dihydropyrimidine dehydrogenase PreA subunit
MGMSSVVKVNQEKCTNCHACISACPTKFCNDGSGNAVTINPDLCIGCGQCIDACTWKA